MSPFSSKELYMMNGGNKLYIYKDGFGDSYDATPAEEAEWKKEVIANSLAALDSEKNAPHLKAAIDNLLFHKQQGMQALLITKMKDADPLRQIVLAGALWTISRYEKSFEILFQHLQNQRDDYLNDVFLTLADFKDNREAKLFLVSCIEGTDAVLFSKARTTLEMWAYSGMSALRENDVLNALQIENKDTADFKTALQQLKQILELL